MLKTGNIFDILDGEMDSKRDSKKSKKRSKKSKVRSEPKAKFEPVKEVPPPREILCTVRGRHLYKMEKESIVYPVNEIVIPIHSMTQGRPISIDNDMEDSDIDTDSDWDHDYAKWFPMVDMPEETEEILYDYETERKYRGKLLYI
jgi:hypothetical protein